MEAVMYFPHIDPLYLIMSAPVFLFSLVAQFMVKSNFNKYSRVRVQSGLTGAQAAETLLKQSGMTEVKIAQAGGFLGDHYSPRQKTVALSGNVINTPSVAALGVAAHEVGHALQHHSGMGLMRVWNVLAVPLSVASNLSIWLIVLGAFISITLAQVGFFVFAGVVAFQILTLPLEFNASRRAKEMLLAQGMITEEERKGVNKVLNSAALTYVAAAAASLTYLLYFAIRLGFFSRRN
jgi:Zn-dependent membrane protease YugP